MIFVSFCVNCPDTYGSVHQHQPVSWDAHPVAMGRREDLPMPTPFAYKLISVFGPITVVLWLLIAGINMKLYSVCRVPCHIVTTELCLGGYSAIEPEKNQECLNGHFFGYTDYGV